MSNSPLTDLENFLRAHQDTLCAQTAARFQELLASASSSPQSLDSQDIEAGASYLHQLAMVAAALYPSETTLRQQYGWATHGMLRQKGVLHEHQALILKTYFGAVRDLSEAEPDIQAAAADLEVFMKRILADTFGSTRTTPKA